MKLENLEWFREAFRLFTLFSLFTGCSLFIIGFGVTAMNDILNGVRSPSNEFLAFLGLLLCLMGALSLFISWEFTKKCVAQAIKERFEQKQKEQKLAMHTDVDSEPYFMG